MRKFLWIVCLPICLLTAVACHKKGVHQPPVAGAFANVPESEIVGRYKWFENDVETGAVALDADHSLTNPRGERKGGYKWELQKEGLLLIWLRDFNFFPRVIAPGAYEGEKDSKMVRIEKQ